MKFFTIPKKLIHSLTFESRYFVEVQFEMREKGMTVEIIDRDWSDNEIDFAESMKSKNLYAAPVGISIDKIG